MRKKFILFGLLPLVLIVLTVYIFLDSWVESGLETAGEEMTGAKVEIDNLHVSFVPLGIKWSRLQAADPRDPWKNIIETGNVSLSLDPAQLLRGKYIVNEMIVSDIVPGTKRTTDGSLPKEENEKAASENAGNSFGKSVEDVFNRTIRSTPVFDIAKLSSGQLNIDSLVKSFDFKTLKNIDSLRNQISSSVELWNTTLQEIETTKNKVETLALEVKAINPAELNNVERITSAIATVERTVKTYNEITGAVSTKAETIKNGVNKFTASVDSIDNFAESDFRKLKAYAKLPNFSADGIGELLVGNEMYKRAMGYLYWVDFARTNIKKYSPEPDYQKPPRFEGQDIKFPEERGYPKLWIKKILVSGGTAKKTEQNFLYAEGNVNNVTDNQKLTGLPLTVKLEGNQSNIRRINLSAFIDRRKDIPFDEYDASLTGVPVGSFSIGRSDFLPANISDGRMSASVSIKVPGSSFDSRIDFNLAGIKMNYAADPKNEIEKIVRRVLDGIKGLNVSLSLWNTSGNMDVAISTDLDEQISARVMQVLGEELTKIQNNLRAKFDDFVTKKQKEFENFYAEKKSDIENRLNINLASLNGNLEIIQQKKKELTDKLEKEKAGFIEKNLKDLFKK